MLAHPLHPPGSAPDVVGKWNVNLSDRVHIVKFEHWTTTGKRIVYVDGKEVSRQNWMFRLDGREHFTVGKTKAFISIECQGNTLGYTIFVEGVPLEKFVENRRKTSQVWILKVDRQDTRIVLGKKGTGFDKRMGNNVFFHKGFTTGRALLVRSSP